MDFVKWCIDKLAEKAILLKKEAGTILIVLGLGLAVGFWVATWNYDERLKTSDARLELKDDELRSKETEIARLRVATGIDPASEGVLMGLKNAELAAKGLGTSSKVRELCIRMRDRMANLQDQKESGKLDSAAHGKEFFSVARAFGDEYDRTLRADTVNLDTELRRRLGPRTLATIPGLPFAIREKGDDGPGISITSLLPSGTELSGAFLCVTADSIARMSLLLPPDSRAQAR